MINVPISHTRSAYLAHQSVALRPHYTHLPIGRQMSALICRTARPARASNRLCVCTTISAVRYACASDARPHLRARPMPAHSTRISSKLTKRNVRHAHAAHHTHTHSHTQQHTAVVLAEHVVSCVSHASSARPSRLLYIARPHPTDPLNTSAATYSELDMLFGITLFRCVRQRRAQKRALRSPRVR